MINAKDRHVISIPAETQYILSQLKSFGFEAFVVGGCVRDSLLGLSPQDWDITTNALPEQVIECFKENKVLPTGIIHGTVTVLHKGMAIEVTTYRIDGDYLDMRHPTSVNFTVNLKDDLSRRDFTINALAYNDDVGLVDYFGGIPDLNNKIIRCVGDPIKRFSEDALRIFRCVRFASQLDFIIEDDTAKAMTQLVCNLDFIAKERIRTELNKSLLGKSVKKVFLMYPQPLIQAIPELAPLVNFQQNTPYHIFDVYEHTLVAVESAHKDVIIRLALLLHDIGKPPTYTTDSDGVGHFKGHGRVSVELSTAILNRLRYSNSMKATIIELVRYHDVKIPPTDRPIKRWLRRIGEDNFKNLLMVQRADAKAKAPWFGNIQLEELQELTDALDKVLLEEQCFSTNQLELDGNDLIAIGIKQGPQIGKILNQLVDLVIDDKVSNSKSDLLIESKKIANESIL